MSPNFFIICYTFLSYALDAITIINDETWNDDFVEDIKGIDGWNAFAITKDCAFADCTPYDLTGNPSYVTTGSSTVIGSKYHGPYSQEDNDHSTTWLTRYFECATKSNVYVSYYFSFCQTEYNDLASLYPINNTGNGNPLTADGMQSYYEDSQHTGDYPPFEDTLYLTNAYSRTGVACPNSGYWRSRYESNISLYNTMLPNNAFRVLLRFGFSDTHGEWANYYNIQVQCNQLPTPMPTNNPTKTPTTVPTVFPSTLPTYNPSYIPSNIPSISPTDPSYSPTTHPSMIPSNAPTFTPAPTLGVSSNPTTSTIVTANTTTNELSTIYSSIIYAETDTTIDKQSSSNNDKFRKGVIRISSIMVPIVILICCFVIIYYKRFRHRKYPKDDNDNQYIQLIDQPDKPQNVNSFHQQEGSQSMITPKKPNGVWVNTEGDDSDDDIYKSLSSNNKKNTTRSTPNIPDVDDVVDYIETLKGTTKGANKNDNENDNGKVNVHPADTSGNFEQILGDNVVATDLVIDDIINEMDTNS